MQRKTKLFLYNLQIIFYMIDLKRIKKVVNWLIFSEYAENEIGIAKKLGYTKSSFSQILNGKVNVSEKFIDKLCEADDNINKVWVLEGIGVMLKNSQKIGNIDNSSVVGANVNGTGININGTSSELIDVIKKQQEQMDKLIDQISNQSSQMNTLISMLNK